MRRLLLASGFVVLGGFVVMLGGLLVMMRRLRVILVDVFHEGISQIVRCGGKHPGNGMTSR